MTQETVTAYYEIAITPHHAGFGMYQLGEHSYPPAHAWADLSDLEATFDDFLPLDEALKNEGYIEAGVTDIRGKIYGGDPQYIYVKTDLQMGVLYFGVEEAEVPENYWNG